jgi:DNA modification methylase
LSSPILSTAGLVLKTYLSLKNDQPRPLPDEFRDDDVRYCEALVEYFLQELTQEGDYVFDPFLGFGTTLLVAERLKRVGYGIEFDPRRLQYAQSILQVPERALHGDSMRLKELDLPWFDFSITSPPYMGKHHTENPFTAYSSQGKGYSQYLDDIKSIYEQISYKLKPAAHVVIEVSNLKHENGSVTTLAWDIAHQVSEVLSFQGEVVITWETPYGYGYDHSYCLIFSKQ